MNLLLYCRIAQDPAMPDFGGSFSGHMAQKNHPAVRAASLSAWSLLALGLKMLGRSRLPDVRFEPGGKPYFEDEGLFFSLSHSGSTAAALISCAPCALDVQLPCPDTAARLVGRCLSENEARAGLDFFECWTKKECIAKLSGAGLPARPSQLDTLDAQYEGCFFCGRLEDEPGTPVYAALCTDRRKPRIQKITPEALK